MRCSLLVAWRWSDYGLDTGAVLVWLRRDTGTAARGDGRALKVLFVVVPWKGHVHTTSRTGLPRLGLDEAHWICTVNPP